MFAHIVQVEVVWLVRRGLCAGISCTVGSLYVAQDDKVCENRISYLQTSFAILVVRAVKAGDVTALK